MKPVPQIQKYMTTVPHSIGDDQTLAQAKALMNEHRIRHLPVLHGGKLVGILTDRDVRLVESFIDVDASTTKVSEAMTETPYSTTPDRPVNEVAAEMAEHKYGAAIVVQANKVVGIFTTVDACRALAELFDTRLRK